MLNCVHVCFPSLPVFRLFVFFLSISNTLGKMIVKFVLAWSKYDFCLWQCSDRLVNSEFGPTLLQSLLYPRQQEPDISKHTRGSSFGGMATAVVTPTPTTSFTPGCDTKRQPVVTTRPCWAHQRTARVSLQKGRWIDG